MNAFTGRPIAAAPVTAQSVSRSHVGRVRAINEDRVFDCAAAGLFAVADGMGGHRGGDQAAQAVVDELRRLTNATVAPSMPDVLAALQRANTEIVHRNREQGLDAGATVVVALLDGAHVHIAWAGDSRAYRLRDGELTLLTEDHSVVQEMVAAGLLTDDMAARHPQANVITRALGVNDRVELDRVTLDVGERDLLMLCSDGLSRSLDAATCEQSGTLAQLADRLLDHALRVDGSDNISLVIAAAPRLQTSETADR